MIADYGTKPLVQAVHKRFKYWTTGTSFLPSPGTCHYDLLQMQFYEIIEII